MALHIGNTVSERSMEADLEWKKVVGGRPWALFAEPLGQEVDNQEALRTGERHSFGRFHGEGYAMVPEERRKVYTRNGTESCILFE